MKLCKRDYYFIIFKLRDGVDIGPKVSYKLNEQISALLSFDIFKILSTKRTRRLW